MYNYPPPGQFNRPPSYGNFAGAPAGAPPGVGGAPGMGPPPGVALPPGMQQSQSSSGPRPGALPANFQIPNINFNAPVIRLGTGGPAKPEGGLDSRSKGGANADSAPGGGRRGLGADGRSDSMRQGGQDRMAALIPPTREEIARTVFVGNLVDGVGGDEGIERIMRSAGGLRRWTRAIDAAGKPCRFGFAEFEDAESLETAAEIFKDVKVPVKTQDKQENGEPEMATLLVMIDDASLKYAEEWKSRRAESEDAVHFRIDTAKEALEDVLKSIIKPTNLSKSDGDGDTAMTGGEQTAGDDDAEVVTIPLNVEDELSDIPAEMRETVAAEIAAFRERSIRRDLERLRKEEEMEAAERKRAGGGRINRLASPPPSSAPSGPSGGVNGVPLGPRDKAVAGVPSGPKGYQGVQLPKDYQAGVTFVNGSGTVNEQEDDDSDADDEELEKRRKEKKEADLEKAFLDQERRWLNRERSRAAALERETKRDKDDENAVNKEAETVANRLRQWDDEVEAARKSEEYYRDRSLWLRNRSVFRKRESEADDRDRAAENRERARDAEKREQARGLADSFLDRQAEELDSRAISLPQEPAREPQRFKMSLGAQAAQRAQAVAAAKPKRTAAEVEGLLEDEEEADESSRRTLIPINYDSVNAADGPNGPMSEEERAQAAKQLATEIPTDRDGLWAWDIKWEFVDDSVLTEQIKPFVEKKIMEYLGVQEQMLVDVVEEHVRKRGAAQKLVGDLEEALDEEAEVLVKKLWRMLIFFSESEKRGLSN